MHAAGCSAGLPPCLAGSAELILGWHSGMSPLRIVGTMCCAVAGSQGTSMAGSDSSGLPAD